MMSLAFRPYYRDGRNGLFTPPPVCSVVVANYRQTRALINTALQTYRRAIEHYM